MRTRLRCLDGKKIHWQDSAGVIHSCEAAEVHPGLWMVWTDCQRDVPPASSPSRKPRPEAAMRTHADETLKWLQAERAEARRAALEEALDRIMSIQPDTSATGERHKVGFRSGHAQARYAARALITEMLGD